MKNRAELLIKKMKKNRHRIEGQRRIQIEGNNKRNERGDLVNDVLRKDG